MALLVHHETQVHDTFLPPSTCLGRVPQFGEIIGFVRRLTAPLTARRIEAIAALFAPFGLRLNRLRVRHRHRSWGLRLLFGARRGLVYHQLPHVHQNRNSQRCQPMSQTEGHQFCCVCAVSRVSCSTPVFCKSSITWINRSASEHASALTSRTRSRLSPTRFDTRCTTSNGSGCRKVPANNRQRRPILDSRYQP